MKGHPYNIRYGVCSLLASPHSPSYSLHFTSGADIQAMLLSYRTLGCEGRTSVEGEVMQPWSPSDPDIVFPAELSVCITPAPLEHSLLRRSHESALEIRRPTLTHTLKQPCECNTERMTACTVHHSTYPLSSPSIHACIGNLPLV